MNQLIRIWASLTSGQRISLILVPTLAIAAVFGLVKWKHDSDFRVLYSSLSPEDASAITQKMREANIEYRLDETGATVLVSTEQIAEARLALAGAGLPKTGRIGFELFDRTNLGASDFAEQVNYRRALEGELERTVGTLTEVDQARIHITFAKESVFLDARQPSKATVVLRLKRGIPLAQSSVVAIANLIASAVDGLSPDGVAIIDANGHLLNRPHAQGDGETQLAAANLDYQQQIESELQAKIGAALEPLLGADRFRVGVNVECDFSSSEESQETVDPAKSVILTSQTTEESNGGAAALGGTPGTASNLPRPPVRAGTGSPGILRRTENTSYQPSRIVKRTVSPRGAVRRISTAILLDQNVRWDGAGPKARKTIVPPSPDVIKAVHDMVASISGYSETRGDQITVETLPFENTLAAEPPLPPSAPAKPAQSWNLKQPLVLGIVVGGILVVVLIIGVVFVLVRRRPATPIAVDTASAPIPGSDPAQPVLNAGETAANRMEKLISAQEAQQAELEAEALSRIKLPANTKQSEVLIRHIRDSVTKDAISSTNVLRTWISDLDTKRTS